MFTDIKNQQPQTLSGQELTPQGVVGDGHMDKTSIIFDVSTSEFEQRVIAASMQSPVIVDFWAPWCAPCKQLGPVLEQLVTEASGQVFMAKVNLDENQELAAALRVQSVPAVFAFFQGQPVDGFMGVQPESKLREFISKLISLAKSAQPESLNIPESLVAASQALLDGNISVAQGIYSDILEQDELNVSAYVGMMRAFIADGQVEYAQEMMNNAPDEITKQSGFAEGRSALELASVAPSGSLDDLAKKVEDTPQDHQSRIELAQGLFASGQKMAGVEELLESIKIEREWEDQAARKELLKFFEAMGKSDPITLAGRRKLSSILFS